MDQNKKMPKNFLNRQMVYQLISGILFISLGTMIFVRGNGIQNFFNVGLIGILFNAYGVYRLTLFVKLLKKMKEEQQ
jgi:uncharacterized membrane protein HdeD (DUF308 family)